MLQRAGEVQCESAATAITVVRYSSHVSISRVTCRTIKSALGNMEEKMKKTARILLMLVVLAVALLAVSSCTKDDTNFGEGDKMTLVVAEEEMKIFEIPLKDFKKSDSVLTVLDYLKNAGKLDYEMSGTFVNKVGSLPNVENGYVYFYTTVESDIDVSQYAMTVEYGGLSIVSSGVGAQEMHLENGATVYVGMIVW